MPSSTWLRINETPCCLLFQIRCCRFSSQHSDLVPSMISLPRLNIIRKKVCLQDALHLQNRGGALCDQGGANRKQQHGRSCPLTVKRETALFQGLMLCSSTGKHFTLFISPPTRVAGSRPTIVFPHLGFSGRSPPPLCIVCQFTHPAPRLVAWHCR